MGGKHVLAIRPIDIRGAPLRRVSAIAREWITLCFKPFRAFVRFTEASPSVLSTAFTPTYPVFSHISHPEMSVELAAYAVRIPPQALESGDDVARFLSALKSSSTGDFTILPDHVIFQYAPSIHSRRDIPVCIKNKVAVNNLSYLSSKWTQYMDALDEFVQALEATPSFRPPPSSNPSELQPHPSSTSITHEPSAVSSSNLIS